MLFGFGYLHEDVKDFAKITTPVTDLLKITWTSNCHARFEALKKSLIEAHSWELRVPWKTCWSYAWTPMIWLIGVIIMQKGMVIAHESMKSKNEELIYFIHELKVWRHYLLGSVFEIEIYHQLLWYLTSQATQNWR